MDFEGETKLMKVCAAPVLPCVQELTKQPLKDVPERYVRSDLDDLIPPDTQPQEIPIVDMTKLLSPEFHASELETLDSACKEWGFFQLLNHGAEELVEDVKRDVTEFFHLPMEEKKKYWQKPEDGQGFGQQFIFSDEQKLDWTDAFVLISLPEEARSSRIFPNLPLPLRDNLHKYSIELRKIAVKLVELLGEALKIDPNEIKELNEGGWQSMRMNYYPPCPQADKVIGLSPHSDIGIITIVLQFNDVVGLQVYKEEKWVPVNPRPTAFIVNLGDTLEILSNGIYLSNLHRAGVNPERDRTSIATFFNPKLEGNMGPSPSLVTPQTPPVYKTVTVADFRQRFFSKKLRGKDHLDYIRINKEENQESK